VFNKELLTYLLSQNVSECFLKLSCLSVLHCRGVSKSVVHLNKAIQTHYDVLGVTPSATKTQIRDAFLLLSKQVPRTSHTLLQYSIICGAVELCVRKHVTAD